MYDYLIVGAGLFGSVFAHEAKKKGYKCLVVDKRNHISGNCYTEKIEGIDVHKYGPHIFNTNNKEVWDYIRQFSEFNSYVHRAKASYAGEIFSLPVNLSTFSQVYYRVQPQDAKKMIERFERYYQNPKNFEDYLLSKVGDQVYRALFYGYTKKQWGRDPRTLPMSIAKRIPIRTNFNDNYYDSKYQGIPVDGYTKIFERLLEGIDVQLNLNYWKNNPIELCANKIVYTGPIDQLYKYRYGMLEYRSLIFEQQTLDIEDYQGASIINYTDEYTPYTRIIEHKHFTEVKTEKTVITKEYPASYTNPEEQIPYYPINNTANNNTYQMYKDLLSKEKNIIIGGRLAEYKYYNMDQVIASALDCAKKELQ